MIPKIDFEIGKTYFEDENYKKVVDMVKSLNYTDTTKKRFKEFFDNTGEQHIFCGVSKFKSKIIFFSLWFK